MILLVDNYDSFSYNLVQLIGSIQKDRFEKGDIKEEEEENYGIKVIRNDEMSVEDVLKLNPEAIVLSPGPGRPENAGICEDLIKMDNGNAKILGVCLGHQAIFEAFGGTITYAGHLMLGKASSMTFEEDAIFKDIPQGIKVARYHSLAGDKDTVPDCLQVIATTQDQEIMAVKHKNKNIYGFQFHPESVLTQYGRTMIENFLKK